MVGSLGASGWACLQPLGSGPEALSLSLQCTVSAALGAQETQALPPPSSTKPVVSLPPGPPQLSPGPPPGGRATHVPVTEPKVGPDGSPLPPQTSPC